VFTGSTGSTIASSATPVFSLADVSVKSPIRFEISPIVNVTGPTITNKTAGARFDIAVTTDGTHTWSWNSIVSDNVCPIYTAAAETTIASLEIGVDGTTVHGVGCSTTAALTYYGPTTTAPSVNPSAGNGEERMTATGRDMLDPSGNHFVPIKSTGDVTPATNVVTKVNGGSIPASAPFVGTNSSNQIILATPFMTNAQTATYQALAADFSNYKTIIVASGTFTITLVASGSQPATGQLIRIINYGSGVVTVARSGQNINGGTASLTLAAGSATAPTSAVVVSDGTNYFASVAGGSSGGSGSNTILQWFVIDASDNMQWITGQTGYFPGIGYYAGSPSSTENTVQWVMPRGGTLQAMSIFTATAQGACDLVLTVRDNAADTAFTITVTNGTASHSVVSATGSLAMTAGHLYALKGVNGSCTSAAIQNVSWSIQ
jgi:hypothetical protein